MSQILRRFWTTGNRSQGFLSVKLASTIPFFLSSSIGSSSKNSRPAANLSSNFKTCSALASEVGGAILPYMFVAPGSLRRT